MIAPLKCIIGRISTRAVEPTFKIFLFQDLDGKQFSEIEDYYSVFSEASVIGNVDVSSGPKDPRPKDR